MGSVANAVRQVGGGVAKAPFKSFARNASSNLHHGAKTCPGVA